jgi:hypothetical protein
VSATPVSSLSISEEFRERVDAENSLIAQRVSWLILSQSFLFIAYTASLVARPLPGHRTQLSRLLDVFPVLGVVIVVGTYASIWAGLVSIRQLRARFDVTEAVHLNPFDGLPTPRVRRLGHLAAHVPPIAIGATWLWLLVTNRF